MDVCIGEYRGFNVSCSPPPVPPHLKKKNKKSGRKDAKSTHSRPSVVRLSRGSFNPIPFPWHCSPLFRGKHLHFSQCFLLLFIYFWTTICPVGPRQNETRAGRTRSAKGLTKIRDPGFGSIASARRYIFETFFSSCCRCCCCCCCRCCCVYV